ncbi:MAG: hypothetical protein WC156_14545 [Pedobacter sp.]
MKLFFVSLLIAVSLCLTGCKKIFEIYVAQTPTGNVSFRLEPRQGAENKGSEIAKLQVYREIIPNKTLDMVWSIQTESGNPEKVYTITYGIVPSGFKEVKPAQPLIPGELYDIMSSRPEVTGSASFKYVK